MNIIRGANSTGKSTIVDFIFFVPGGDITKWKPEAGGCDFVVAELKINEALVTFEAQDFRSIGISRWTFSGGDGGWAGVSSRRPGDLPVQAKFRKGELFPDTIPRAGAARKCSDTDSNITMHQLLRI